MKSPPAFQFYPRDFLGDGNVAAMTLAERGAYITLLCSQWTEGSVPGDVQRLANICGTTKREMAKLWPALEPCFAESGPGRLQNKRLERERDIQSAFREEKSRAGRVGAERRWHGHGTAIGKPVAGRVADPLADESQNDGSSSSSSSSTTSSLRSDVSRAASEEPRPSPAAGRPRKPGTGPHAEFLAWFVAQYQLALSTPYPVTAKDGVIVARLLKTFTPEDLRARASRLLTTDDSWLATTDRGLGVLASQVNKPVLRGIEVISGAAGGKRSNFDQTVENVRRVAARLDAEEGASRA